MPEQQGAAVPAEPQRQRGGNFIGGLIRMGVTWYLMKNLMGGQKGPASSNRDDQVWPAFNKSDAFDVFMFLHEYPALPPSKWSEDEAVWAVRNVPLAGPGIDLSHNITYHPTEDVQRNGTLYAHAIFVAQGGALNPSSPDYNAFKIIHRVHPVIAFLPAPRNTTGVNLLATMTDKERAAREAAEAAAAQEEEKLPRKIISFIKPNITLAMVDHFTKYGVKAIPAPLAPHLLINHATHTYDPVVFFNDFWMLRDRLVAMNESVQAVPMQLFLHTMAQWKWQLYMQLQQSLDMQVTMGMSKEGETDELKKVFLEGNPFFLSLTMVVSLLHSVFDMFAFKNDIGFWRNKDNLTGLSVRTILINCFCQLIIFLYLLDSETSFVVLASSFVGTLIEFWKVTKAMDVSVQWRGGLPVPVFKDKATYVDSETKEHDRVAMKYLSYALYPLVAAYAVYTLVYERHKSWYSWLLSTLVGAVYTFGFILMCPQLYLNYKLKSVAHLPWRQMTYKFLNTIIDDLFAFVIKMPTLHRIACFRDDVIFLIFLYQKWIYPVDKTRANEFGYSETPGEGDAAVAANGTTSEGAAANSSGAAAAEASKEPKKER